MFHTFSILPLLICLLFFFSSCQTYFIPVESFRQQFSGFDSTRAQVVTVQGPLGSRSNYKTAAIDVIRAVDKAGKPVVLQNSPALEIRFTDTAGKKTTFYFDLISFDGESVTGRPSRILSFQKTVPLSAVKKIEIQNGRKNFRYVN